MHHSKQLDSLRFIAVFMVLIEHFAHALGSRISAGYFGVDLFFVISGFLITKILLNSKSGFRESYKNFMGRRALRILPIYLLVVLILFLIGDTYIKAYLPYSLTFTFNYAMVFFKLPSNAITHFWTLCIEEQFYFFWPLLVLPMRRYRKWLIAFVIFFLIFCYGQFYFKWVESLVMYRWVGLVPRCFALLIGALGAMMFSEKMIRHPFFTAKKIEWLLLMILSFFLLTNSSFKFIIIPLVCLYFVLKCYYSVFCFRPLDNFLNKGSVVYLGSISYGIYLFHLPLYYYLNTYFFMPYCWDQIHFKEWGRFVFLENYAWAIQFPLFSVMSILLAAISYRYFETPFLKLKDKYFSYNNNLNES